MLERATRICEAQFGNLFLRDGDEDRADVVTGGRRNPVINLPQNPGIPIDRVVRTGQVLHVTDIRTDPSYLAGNPRIVALVDTAGARTFTCVPMLKTARCHDFDPRGLCGGQRPGWARPNRELTPANPKILS